MDNNNYELVLTHHGTKGMKWGIRRYQNKDGTLTPAGKKRYNKELEKLKAEEKILKNRQRTQAKFDKLEAKRQEIEAMKSGKKTEKHVKNEEPKKKTVKDMSDEELAAAIDRLRAEKTYKDAYAALNPQTVSRGKAFIDGALDKGKDLVINIGNDYIDKVARDYLGLNKKKEADSSEELKKLVTDLRNKRDAEELKDDEYQRLKREASKAEWEKKIRDSKAGKTETKNESKTESKGETESKTETKTTSKSEPEQDRKVYEGEVTGEGTSKGSSQNTRTGPIIDVDWREVEVSNVPAVYVNSGADYASNFLKRYK